MLLEATRHKKDVKNKYMCDIYVTLGKNYIELVCLYFYILLIITTQKQYDDAITIFQMANRYGDEKDKVEIKKLYKESEKYRIEVIVNVHNADIVEKEVTNLKVLRDYLYY